MKGTAPLEGENGDSACRHSAPQDSEGGVPGPSARPAAFGSEEPEDKRTPLQSLSLSEKLSSPQNDSTHLPQESFVLLSLLLYGTGLWPFGGGTKVESFLMWSEFTLLLQLQKAPIRRLTRGSSFHGLAR